MTAKKLALTAVFICFAAALSALETMLPPICPIAGVRVGLGNIVIMFILYIGDGWSALDALAVVVLRCALAALIVGSPMSMIYGLMGGAAAWGAMLAARRLFPKKDGKPDPKYLPFTAVFGSVSHIAGQMLAAVVIYGTTYVLAYTPILLASALIGGVFTGFLTMLLLGKLPRRLLENIRSVKK